MKRISTVLVTTTLILSALTVPLSAHAALALDRTRVILEEDSQSAALGITNQSHELPFLAQSWIEDAQGNKITSPLVALPPIQRVEAGDKSQVKVQTTAAMNLLARDRESLFYFNLREIPPKSSKPNTLQIALQTRIKLFYRPSALHTDQNSKPWQEQVTLTRNGDRYVANNPTPYFVTFTAASPNVNGADIKDFKPIMIAPKESATFNVSASSMGNSPVLTYINDYGGRPRLIFGCDGATCSVKSTKAG